jgi:hypothetical protein
LENNGEREKVPKDQRLLLQDNKHVSTKAETRNLEEYSFTMLALGTAHTLGAWEGGI